MTRTLVGLMLMVMLLSAPVIAQSERPVPITVDALNWFRPPGNAALRAAWVLGDEQASAPYVLRVKLSAGGGIAPHTHPDQRIATVLSGTLYAGFGSEVKSEEMVAIPAGSVYVVPAGQSHYLQARDHDVTYQESGTGPTAQQPIAPSTAPSKKEDAA